MTILPKRTRTPTVLQMEAVECGAACLTIILAYHGRIVPLERLREECGVSRDGSKAVNLLRTARSFGLEAKGFKYEVSALKGASLPAIIFWRFNHFVVLEGFGRDGRAYINDPAHGPRTVTAEEFGRSFTGLALIMSPGPGFQRGGIRRSLLPGILNRLKGLNVAVTYSLLCGLFLVLPGLVIPTLLRLYLNHYYIDGEGYWVRPLLFAMVATFIVVLALNALQSYYLLRLQTRMALESASAFFAHVVRLPMMYYAQRFSGEVSSRVELNDRIADLLGGEFLKIALDLVMVIFFGLLMAMYDVRLTLVVVAITCLNFAVLKIVQRSREDASQRMLTESGNSAAASINGLAMIETLKAAGAENDFFMRWAGFHANATRASQDIAYSTALTAAMPGLLAGLNMAAILSIGGVQIINGEMTIGSLVAFQVLAISFSSPVSSLANFGASLQTLKGAMKRVDDVLDQEEDACCRVERRSPGMPVVRLAGRLELRNVSFGYSRLDPPLIQNFSLVLEPGMRVALVGGSGGGKSTVIKLASGLFHPWEGDVLYDGRPLDELPRAAFAGSVSVVDQDIFLFEGTVHDNLTLWDAGVAAPDILNACKDADILTDIMQRPGGLQSQVGESGSNFSAGQRQRLEIARALVQNPALLILDEATSALDAETEVLIDRNIRRRGCSCLIAAHRISTIRDADEIIVLEQGKIVERGRYEDLLARGGAFSELIRE